MKTKNKKGSVMLGIGIALGVLLLLSIMLISFIASNYNTLVNKDTIVEESWGQVQNSYMRQLDLLPNLARTVKASSDFEKQTLVGVAQARGGFKSANTPAQLDEANKPVAQMYMGMLSYVENYPNIKSTEQYRALMDEIAGSQNRIAWDRNNYNKVVKDYKQQVRSFPSNIIAGMFGFEQSKWQTFTALDNASVAPTLNFN